MVSKPDVAKLNPASDPCAAISCRLTLAIKSLINPANSWPDIGPDILGFSLLDCSIPPEEGAFAVLFVVKIRFVSILIPHRFVLISAY
jgi:hypothetical protein